MNFISRCYSISPLFTCTAPSETYLLLLFDVMSMSSADGNYEVSYKPNVVIDSRGTVLWIPPAIFKSSCTIEVEYFPFDEQDCEMKFGSWTFGAKQVSKKGKLYGKRGHWNTNGSNEMFSEQTNLI